MTDEKKDTKLIYDPCVGSLFLDYRKNIIACLGSVSEELVVRSEDSIQDYEEKLTLINFLYNQLKMVNTFISSYVPIDSDTLD